MKRADNKEASVSAKSTKSTIVDSPAAERRLKQTDSHFMVNAINIASLAVLTSVGVNYILDQYKEKKDTVLREEIKDRMIQGSRET